MINMILYWGDNKEEVIKVLLDTGSSVPILADRVVKGYQIPVVTQVLATAVGIKNNSTIEE